ncbi:MAG TPA: co-chaperone GroES [Rhabdochlamydiaceae bacterium]|nr:co-chaperone GroES [Rhabdochlamydiaceae bacterium]
MSHKNIKPLGNRVLVKRSEAKTTKGGIILPDTAQEKPKQGEVVATGPGKIDENGKRQVLHVKVGDKVLFSSYAGTEVKTEDHDVEYLIMSEDDILGVLN